MSEIDQLRKRIIAQRLSEEMAAQARESEPLFPLWALQLINTCLLIAVMITASLLVVNRRAEISSVAYQAWDTLPTEVTDRVVEAFPTFAYLLSRPEPAAPIALAPSPSTPNPTDQIEGPSLSRSDTSDFSNENDVLSLAPFGENDAISGASEPPRAVPAPFSKGDDSFGELFIPAMEVAGRIADVPLVSGSWDISTLDDQIGLLENTGRFPHDTRSMTFVGHSTTYWPVKGPFGDLHRLSLGDEILYRYDNMDYRYEITRFMFIDPESSHLILQNDGEKILLVTCSNYDLFIGRYDKRLLVEATLVDRAPFSDSLTTAN